MILNQDGKLRDFIRIGIKKWMYFYIKNLYLSFLTN